MTDRQCIIGMAVCIAGILLTLLLMGCENKVADTTPLGIRIMGDASTELQEDIDSAYLEALHCWGRELDGVFSTYPSVRTIRVWVADFDGPCWARGSSFAIKPWTRYKTIRHEASHAVGFVANGTSIHNGDGRCFL